MTAEDEAAEAAEAEKVAETGKAAEPAAGQREQTVISRSGQLRKLFFSTFYLSAFTFGGGYVIVTLLKNKFVDELHWIDDNEMLDLVAIAQSAPGPIAVNGAIVIGYRIAGLAGVFVSVLGAALPPFLILTVVSGFYAAFRKNFVISAMLSGMKSGVSAVIISVVYDMGSGVVRTGDRVLIFIMVLAFVLNYFYKVNVVFIILGAAAFGILRTVVRERTRQRQSGKEEGAE